MKSFQASLKTIAMATAVGVLVLPGVTNAQSKTPDGAHKMTMPMADSSPMPSTDFMAVMTKMRSQMDAMKMTGNVDQDFAMMMRTHHQGAIDMAKAELASGKDPELRKMAQKTIDDQTREIAKLDRWMAKKEHSMK